MKFVMSGSEAMTRAASSHATPESVAADLELAFQPPLGMRSPHVQAVVGTSALRRRQVERQTAGLRQGSRAEILECPDGTRLEVKLCRHDEGGMRPLLLGLHGWHGCADSLYMLTTCSRLFAAGFDVARLNMRDHGDTHGLNLELFHSCRLDELVQAIGLLRERFPGRPMALLGFSLGGSFALRAARVAPAAGIDIDQVLAVCPVLDPTATMDALDGGWFGYRLYFMRRWRQSLAAKQRHFPDRYDFSETRGLRSIEAMTDWFVTRHTEFASSERYLAGYTITGDHLEGLEVQSTLITALDDPVIPASGLQQLARPKALTVAVTRHGGHCGFLSDYRMASWLDGEVERRLRPLLG
ncbi:MAG: alpha/beta fold hydrolase [Gammaproteobacteria bacterium]|nr:alpha/beta fold hydrolase [Gammaproteobacteria bacterium]